MTKLITSSELGPEAPKAGHRLKNIDGARPTTDAGLKFQRHVIAVGFGQALIGSKPHGDSSPLPVHIAQLARIPGMNLIRRHREKITIAISYSCRSRHV